VTVRKDLGKYDGLSSSRNGRLYGYSPGMFEQILEAEIDGVRGVVTKPATVVPTRSQGYTRGGDYSPDGRSLAYVSGLTESEAAVYVRDLASGAVKRYNAPPVTRLAKWYPDGRALVVWTAGQKAEERNLYRLELATGELKRIPAAAVLMDAATNPTVSPDGRSLYYKGGAPEGGGRAIRRIDLTTGAEAVVAQGGIRMFALSPDGTAMLYSRRDAGNRDSLVIVPVDGGAERTVYTYPEGELSRGFGGMWWMADGKGILFHFPTGDRTDALWMLRLDGSAPRKVLDGGTIYAGDAHPDGKRHVWQALRAQPELWTIDDAVR
jgi:Tol biopolymer transport system component